MLSFELSSKILPSEGLEVGGVDPIGLAVGVLPPMGWVVGEGGPPVTGPGVLVEPIAVILNRK